MDKNCSIAPAAVIGENPEEDQTRFPFITPSGIVVLPKGTHVPASGPIEFTRDMAFSLENDPSVKPILQNFNNRYDTCEADRHSHDSAGPRYRKYGPGALISGAQNK
jgi:hypothetical protein